MSAVKHPCTRKRSRNPWLESSRYSLRCFSRPCASFPSSGCSAHPRNKINKKRLCCAVCQVTDGKQAFYSILASRECYWPGTAGGWCSEENGEPSPAGRKETWLQKGFFLIHTYYLGWTQLTAGSIKDESRCVRQGRTCSLQPDVFVSDISVVARGVLLPGELKWQQINK